MSSITSRRKYPVIYEWAYTQRDKGPGPSIKKACISDDLEGDTSSNDAPSTSSTRTKIKSLAKFITFSKTLETLSFPQKIAALKGYMSPQSDGHDIYIEIDGVEELDNPENKKPEKRFSIKLSLEKQPFTSSSFREANIKENPGSEAAESYHVLRVFEYIEDPDNPEASSDTRVMKLYASQTGLKGELAWLQQGYYIKGPQLAKIYKLLEVLMPIQLTYLYDDAKKPMGSTEHSLRKLQVLTSSPLNEQTWYEKHFGFAPAVFQTPFVAKKDTFIQNQDAYRKAIQSIRRTQIKTLQKTHRQFRSKLQLLSKHYLTNDEPKNLHSLLRTMNDATRVVAADNLTLDELESFEKAKEKASNDLAFVFTNIIENYKITSGTFLRALHQLDEMRIYTKSNPPHTAS